MLPIVIFCVFIAAIVVGSLVANALGRLPNSEELALEDQRRWGQIEREQ
jgi:hypothetical protein